MTKNGKGPIVHGVFQNGTPLGKIGPTTVTRVVILLICRQSKAFAHSRESCDN